MFLLFLLGSLLVFGNVTNPDIQSDTLGVSLDYLNFQDQVIITEKAETVAVFEPGGGTWGTDLRLLTRNKLWPSWRHALGFRFLTSSEYQMRFYTTGLTNMMSLNSLPVSLGWGINAGQAEMEIRSLSEWGSVSETLGMDAFVEMDYHFIWGDRLWSLFLQPSYQWYKFQFSGKSNVADHSIDASGGMISTGMSVKF
ncbi:MAG: hypothetical protein HQM11_13940 [SAR324 cluster bacterium]|nr:hypothetical protein [SAR324 cluster bacterium]